MSTPKNTTTPTPTKERMCGARPKTAANSGSSSPRKNRNTMSQIKKGEIPIIGVNAMCAMHTGWTSPDPQHSTPDAVQGYNVSDYFDSNGAYKGADEFGVEPTFREMTDEEIAEYIE